MEAAATLRGRRILVIDDDYLVAAVVIAFLEEAGAEILGPIGGADEAITFIKENGTAIDGAVLDVNLHGAKSYPVADALAAHEIGFIFATGYGADAVDGDYRKYPRCEKPFNGVSLVATLAKAIR
jgi:DNA-binding LytR/AlgR family response regulator